MFSVFLMMINIIHNRISLTHMISVHSHRGAYTFHLHVSINDNVPGNRSTFDQSCQPCP